jgi:hypothetical protein
MFKSHGVNDRQGGIHGGKYLERRKVKKPDRYQSADGPAEYYTSQVPDNKLG